MVDAGGSAGPTVSRDREPLPFFAYLAVCLVAMAVILPAGLATARELRLETLAWIVFLAATNLLSLPALPRGNLEVSVGAPVTIATVVLLPPPLVALVNCVGFVSEREFRRPVPVALSLFNRCQLGLSAGLAGWVVHSQAWLSPIAATAVAVVVYNVINTAFVSVGMWTRGKFGLTAAAKGTTMPFPRFALDFGLVTLLALFIVVGYQSIGTWAVVLVALPLWLGFRALKYGRELEDRATELVARVRELETLNAAATEFLTARSAGHAATVAMGALGRALETDAVTVSLDGDVPADASRAIGVPGAEPAVIGVPDNTDEPSIAVVEAIAGLLGMTLVRQELESELAEVQRARAALSGRILEEGTRERSRIALEIHDDVLPSLAAAQIQADNVRYALKAGAVEQASEIAGAAHDAAHDSIARLREVLDDLHRQILVPGALRTFLQDALHELKMHHGVDVCLNAPEELPEVPHALEILVGEIVRGCLANVARHADAHLVTVDLSVSSQALAVEVRDDGRGFDPDAIPDGHHGLALMAQRVELARGRFLVTSAPGGGTHVHVEVPM